MKRALVFALVFGALVVGVAWHYGRLVPSGAAEDVTPSASGQTLASGANPFGAAGRDVPSGTKLPGENVGVRSVIEQLTAHAEAGERTALCRLGFELARCREATLAAEAIETSAARIRALPFDERTRDELLRRMDTQRKTKSAGSRLCDGVSRQEMDSAFRYLISAAQQDDVASTMRLVTTPPLAPRSEPKDADRWKAYETTVPGALMRAISIGEPRALYFGQWAAMGNVAAGGVQLVDRDLYRALVYGYAVLPVLSGVDAAQVEKRNVQLIARVGKARAAAAVLAAQHEYPIAQVTRHNIGPSAGVIDNAVSGCQ